MWWSGLRLVSIGVKISLVAFHLTLSTFVMDDENQQLKRSIDVSSSLCADGMIDLNIGTALCVSLTSRRTSISMIEDTLMQSVNRRRSNLYHK